MAGPPRWMLPPLLLLVLLLGGGALAARQPVTESSDCHGVPIQSGVDYEKMRGTWYVVEVAEHLPAQLPARAPAATPACPRVEVWPAAPRLRLQWREGGKHLDYDLRLPEPDHASYWLSDRPQNGSFTKEENYRQFEGAVLMTKVTADHAVLTFCAKPGADRQVYSVVLARKPSLPHLDLESVNDMLLHRGLPLSGLKRTCKDYRAGGAAPAAAPLLCALGLALLAARARP